MGASRDITPYPHRGCPGSTQLCPMKGRGVYGWMFLWTPLLSGGLVDSGCPQLPMCHVSPLTSGKSPQVEKAWPSGQGGRPAARFKGRISPFHLIWEVLVRQKHLQSCRLEVSAIRPRGLENQLESSPVSHRNQHC